MSDSRTYLPWVRTGLPSLIAAPDSPNASLPARATATIDLRVNDAAGRDPSRIASIGVRLYGPSEVAGIDADVIVRTEPPRDAVEFEPNYFAFIEFRSPDLPWIFTPASPDADRLRPWLCLAAIPLAAATVTANPGHSLPVLETLTSELPEISESWAWAHTQVLRSATAGTIDPIAQTMQYYPERVVSRLVCPRRLHPDTRYLACVVPVFEAGRKAGLGEPLASDDDKLKPAWIVSKDGKSVRLPVYYQWQFATGPDGDFESLLSRVNPVFLSADSGVATVDVGNPGWTMPVKPVGHPDSVVPLEGVLRNPTASPKAWNPAARTEFQTRLQTVLNAGAQAPQGRPLVLPPIYGGAAARQPTVPLQGGSPVWLREVNLDPVLRAAAGAGAMVVRFEQERLMSEAWRQLRDHQIQDDNLRLRQLAESIKQRLTNRLAVTADPASPAAPAGLRKLLRPGGPVARHALKTASRRAVSFAAAAAPPSVASPPQAEITEPERFSPRFPDATYEGFRIYFPELMLPGIGQLDANSIILLGSNPKFIEAYLLGMNHEMGRELLWRGYPLRPRATFFRSFWTAGGADIDEVDSWDPASGLGTHLQSAGAAQTVLLLRADLVRRFPRVRIYAAAAVRAADGTRAPGPQQLQPVFHGRWSEDALLLGFSLSPEDARGEGGRPGWFFVIEEGAGDARFGLDSDGAPPRAIDQIRSWDSLRWEDLMEAASGANAPLYLQLAGRIAGIKDARAVRAAAPSGPKAVWGRNSAHMAAITEQMPFRVAIHASQWLPKYLGE